MLHVIHVNMLPMLHVLHVNMLTMLHVLHVHMLTMLHVLHVNMLTMLPMFSSIKNIDISYSYIQILFILYDAAAHMDQENSALHKTCSWQR